MITRRRTYRCYGHRPVSVGRSHIIRTWWDTSQGKVSFAHASPADVVCLDVVRPHVNVALTPETHPARPCPFRALLSEPSDTGASWHSSHWHKRKAPTQSLASCPV